MNQVHVRLRHMRCAIAHARLCTRLKQRRAKKSTPCLIKKASRCAADRTSKTTLFVFHFYITQRSYEKIMCIYLLFDWFMVKIVLFLHYIYVLYTKDDRLDRLKRNMSGGQIVFLTSLIIALT